METVIEKKLKWENFEPQFGSWAPKIKPFFDRGGFEPIYAFLKQRSAMGKTITPRSADTFKAFRETPYSDLKLIIMGLCPYHTIVQEGESYKMVADGIAMSCGNHSKYQAPSLENFYKALEHEFENGLCLPCLRPQSLKYLCEQGILLTNAQLTTEVGKPGIHEEIWRPFTKFMCENAYSISGVPVIFLGNAAQWFSRYLAPMQWSFDVSHPASASYAHKKWDSEQVFSKVQKIIYDTTKVHLHWLMEEPPF